MGKVIELTDKNFDERVKQSDKPVLIDFWASWCGPCRVMAPIVEEVAEAHDEIIFAKLNVDDYPQIAARYGIMSIPTFVLFEKGEIKDQIVGAMTKEEFLARLGLEAK
jgi:thioredoxin 1